MEKEIGTLRRMAKRIYKIDRNRARDLINLKTLDADFLAGYLKEKFPKREPSAKEVLRLAEPKNSPIHKFFDWSDTEAAAKWRLRQARELIQCLIVIIDGQDQRKYLPPMTIELNGEKTKFGYLDREPFKTLTYKQLKESFKWPPKKTGDKELDKFDVDKEVKKAHSRKPKSNTKLKKK